MMFPLVHGVLAAGGGGGSDPLAGMFVSGEQGFLYRIRKALLFRDMAGTIPVASDGDPVGLMLDLSGNGNHAYQDSTPAKPLYRTNGVIEWLEWDGTKFMTIPPEFTGGAFPSSTIMLATEITPLVTGVASLLDIRDHSSGVRAGHVTYMDVNERHVVGVRTADGNQGFTGTSMAGITMGPAIVTSQYDQPNGTLNGYVGNEYTGALIHDINNEPVTGSPVTDAASYGTLYAARGSTGVSYQATGKFFGGFYIDRVITEAERNDGFVQYAEDSGIPL